MICDVFFINYRPQRSCGKVIFSQASVNHSVQGGGVSARHPPRPWQTSPRQTPHCPVHAGIHPLADTPQCMLGYTHTPAQCMLGYTPTPPPPAVATAADGTHPTGIPNAFLFKGISLYIHVFLRNQFSSFVLIHS